MGQRMILELEDGMVSDLADMLVGDSVFGEDGEFIGYVGPLLEQTEWYSEHEERRRHVRKKIDKARRVLSELEDLWCLNLKQRDDFLDANHQMSGTVMRLKRLCTTMYGDMLRALERSTDTVWAGDGVTLRDEMDVFMEVMHELGIEPTDYKVRMAELGRDAE